MVISSLQLVPKTNYCKINFVNKFINNTQACTKSIICDINKFIKNTRVRTKSITEMERKNVSEGQLV